MSDIESKIREILDDCDYSDPSEWFDIPTANEMLAALFREELAFAVATEQKEREIIILDKIGLDEVIKKSIRITFELYPQGVTSQPTAQVHSGFYDALLEWHKSETKKAVDNAAISFNSLISVHGKEMLQMQGEERLEFILQALRESAGIQLHMQGVQQKDH